MSDKDKSKLERKLAEKDLQISEANSARRHAEEMLKIEEERYASLKALITQQCNQARIDEGEFIERWAGLAVREGKFFDEWLPARKAELQAQAKETSNIIVHPNGVGEIIVDEAKETEGK